MQQAAFSAFGKKRLVGLARISALPAKMRPLGPMPAVAVGKTPGLQRKENKRLFATEERVLTASEAAPRR